MFIAPLKIKTQKTLRIFYTFSKSFFSKKACHSPFSIFFVAFTLMIPVSLGIWQMKRLSWKEALISNIEAGKKANIGTAMLPYHRLQITGVPVEGVSAVVLMPGADGRLNYSLFMPVKTVHGLLWVRHHVQPHSEHMPHIPQKNMNLKGVLRPTQNQRTWGFSTFTHGLWLTPNLDKMDAHYHIHTQPLWLDTTEKAEIEAFRHPPNHHLQYALTWWGLAGAGAIVYGLCLL